MKTQVRFVSRRALTLGALGLAVLNAGCSLETDEEGGADGVIDKSKEELWSPAGTQYWPNGKVRVCFDAAFWNDSAMNGWRANVQTWLKTEITPFTSVNFTDFTKCATTAGQEWLKLQKASTGNSDALQFGYVADNKILFGGDRDNQNVVLHEVGHKLGYAHEFNNPGTDGCAPADQNTTGGTFWTKYDRDSIMNSSYCQANQVLSAWDRAGLTLTYGRRSNTFIASLSGSDAADPTWTGWVSMAGKANPSGGSLPALSINDILVGNFVNDSQDEPGRVTDDLLVTTGSEWFVSSSGYRPWVLVNTSTIRASSLMVGDFNKDGISDVFLANGSTWRVSYAGSSAWQTLNTSAATKAELLIGDFDNDGTDDVLRISGGRWLLSSGGTGAFVQVNSSGATIADLKVGNFDGGGKDIFYGNGTSWRYSSGATGAWQTLTSSAVLGRDVLVANFDGSGGDDVFASISGSWRVSAEARSGWTIVGSSGFTVADLRVANFGLDKASVFK